MSACSSVAVTSAVDKAAAFGLPEANLFRMWDWVGGRYSLWSAVGLPIALAIGMNSFERLLAGAQAMVGQARVSGMQQ